jgi:hypothetical protein
LRLRRQAFQPTLSRGGCLGRTHLAPLRGSLPSGLMRCCGFPRVQLRTAGSPLPLPVNPAIVLLRPPRRIRSCQSSCALAQATAGAACPDGSVGKEPYVAKPFVRVGQGEMLSAGTRENHLALGRCAIMGRLNNPIINVRGTINPGWGGTPIILHTRWRWNRTCWIVVIGRGHVAAQHDTISSQWNPQNAVVMHSASFCGWCAKKPYLNSRSHKATQPAHDLF